jgi:hypothetical protein
MPVLTVRISEKEKVLLSRRAKASGLTAGALVRQLINEPPITTGAELLAEMEKHMGDPRLRIRTRK